MKNFSISSAYYSTIKLDSKKLVFTVLSCSVLQISFLSALYYNQKAQLNVLLEEIDVLETFIETQQPIVKTKAQLKQEYEFLINKKNQLKGNSDIPKTIMTTLAKKIPTDCYLSSITLKDNRIIIKGIAKKWHSLSSFLTALTEAPVLGAARLKNAINQSQHLLFEIEFLRN